MLTREQRKRTADAMEQQQHPSRPPDSQSHEADDAVVVASMPRTVAAGTRTVGGITSASLSSSNFPSSEIVLPSHITEDNEGFLSLKSLPPKSSSNKKKRRRKKKVLPPHLQKTKMPLENLPPLALENILSYVADSTKELQMIVSTVKSFRQVIIGRPDIVIQAGIFSGGNIKSITEELMVRHIQPQNIYIPSTLRLLRLLNATYCERGTKCFKYNTETKTPQKLFSTKRPYGLCLCSACSNDIALQMSSQRQMKRFIEMGFFQHPLLVTTEGKNLKMQRMTLNDSISSEPIGCLITAGKAAQIASTYWSIHRARTTAGHGNNNNNIIIDGTVSGTSEADTAADDGTAGSITNSSSSNVLAVDASNATTSSGRQLTDQEAYNMTMTMIKQVADDARSRHGRSTANIGKINKNEKTTGSISGISNHELSTTVNNNNNHQVELLVSTFTDAVNSYPAFVESKKVLARKVEFDRAQKKRHRAKAKGGAKVWKMIQNLIRSTSSSQEEENKEEEQEDGVDDGENEQLQEEEDLLLYLLSLNEEEDENQKQNGNAEVNNRTTGTTKPDELIEKARPFLNDYPWLFEHKFDKKGYCRFSIVVVDDTLGPLCRAPTTATKKKIMNGICDLVPKLILLEESGFLTKSDGDDENIVDWPFLDVTLPVEGAIWRFLDLHVTVKELLSRAITGHSAYGREFWSLLGESKPVDALYRVLTAYGWYYQRTRAYLSKSDLYKIYVLGVVFEYDEASRSEEKKRQYYCVAESVWMDSPISRVTLNTLQQFEADYTRLRNDFRRLISSIQAYMASYQTLTFLAERDGPALAGAEQTFSRLDAVNSMFGPDYLIFDRQAREWLLSRNFEALLAHHREVFANPLRFGFTP